MVGLKIALVALMGLAAAYAWEAEMLPQAIEQLNLPQFGQTSQNTASSAAIAAASAYTELQNQIEQLRRVITEGCSANPGFLPGAGAFGPFFGNGRNNILFGKGLVDTMGSAAAAATSSTLGQR